MQKPQRYMVIPHSGQYAIYDRHTNSIVTRVDEQFLALAMVKQKNSQQKKG